MSTVADYAGRTVDLLAFQDERAVGEALLRQTLCKAGEGGEVISGVGKLVQRWLVEFLTVVGSLPFLPLRGCDFIGQVRRGELRTTVDAEQAFHLAAQTVRASLAAEDEDGIPLDEALDSTTLLALTIVGDTIRLRIRLTTQAGASTVVLLPIAVKPG